MSRVRLALSGAKWTISAALVLVATGQAWAQSNTCATATPATIGTEMSGANAGATNDGSAPCGSSAGSPDVWYQYTATEDRLFVVDTCGFNGYDTVLSIHTGCPGTSANSLTCNDDSCGLLSRVQALVTTGNTYFVRVAGYGGATGTFRIHFALQDPPPPPSLGPDVYVAELLDIGYYASIGGVSSFAIGTDACNRGDLPAEWIAGNNQHPVIAQNFYRLKNGRFEQIGQSWLKHGFASTNSESCGSCIQPPNGGSQLGLGCSDAYGSGLNGSQNLLGPRSQVNARTGNYPYPFSGAAVTNGLHRRLQVKTVDLDPAQNAGALYFGETQYVTADDAQWNNGVNNVSYRRMNVTSATSAPTWNGATIRMEPALRAWATADPTVTLVPVDYVEGDITTRFWVGSKVTNNGNGTWTYEYAVHNLNSDRSGGSFSVPVDPGVTVSNVDFHDVDSHSGEPFDLTDWPTTNSFGELKWSTTQTHAQNANANALRWGTLYNFRFTANVAPLTGPSPSIGLFVPGTPSSVSVPAVQVPGFGPCTSDFNHDGSAGTDADITDFFAALGGNRCATCSSADHDRDGDVGTDADIESFFRVLGGGPC